jgi:hypothetical protein
VTARPTEFAYAGDPTDVHGKLLVEFTLPKAERPLCDFCGLRLGVGYSDFYAEPFARLERDAGPMFPDGLLITYDARWAACRFCAPHVRRRAWPKLAELVCRRRRDAGHPVTSRRRAEFIALWMQLEQLLDDDARAS